MELRTSLLDASWFVCLLVVCVLVLCVLVVLVVTRIDYGHSTHGSEWSPRLKGAFEYLGVILLV